ncbi:type IV toxin-antitoxin system AbiEi family antitoxin domain-containing protein [Aeromicrobium sp.]|uniref:type IV toxin-antitoxin system AbiEi family antitoxin domain-containing protein n=1 Tax=Aeromicrobium sp. TaxID=1871063 RepID=UPI0028B22CCC|nr:type IV toxin-antitoxin system AbiEi family antitoxin domain-containing protein [Aeromicrobium sp.]
MRDQSGVVSRSQLKQVGWTDADVRRAVRRRELTPVHRGVYVDHTGPLTWEQRAWAAVLTVWPAALCDESALRAFDPDRTARDDDSIHVAIDRGRTAVAPAGVVLHHRIDLESHVAWNLGPPRLHHDEVIIDVAVRQRRRLDAVAVLADAVGSRRTTAQRLITVIGSRKRVRDRHWLVSVLRDIESGTWSVLEHGYLTRVERPHGLPGGRRQVRHVAASGTRYRDVEVPGLAVIELDGRRFHSGSRQRDRDLERDLDAAAEAQTTVRLGYGQVFDRPCRTAAKVAAVLAGRGWAGQATSCGPSCEAMPRIAVTR